MLLRRWGRIVNITSPSATMPLPGQANYAASKAGLVGLTRALSRELAAHGVLVNAVSPGMIDTEMLEAMPAAKQDASPAGGRGRSSRHGGRSRPGGRVSCLGRCSRADVIAVTGLHRPVRRWHRRQPDSRLDHICMYSSVFHE